MERLPVCVQVPSCTMVFMFSPAPVLPILLPLIVFGCFYIITFVCIFLEGRVTWKMYVEHTCTIYLYVQCTCTCTRVYTKHGQN